MAISEEQKPAFLQLLGKTGEEIKMALIENAADVEEGEKEWMYRNRDNIQALGIQIDFVDLREYLKDKNSLKSRLSDADIIWLGGGNTYYLRWILRETHADQVIRELVASGKVYGGGSAGAVVAGPTIQYFEKADSPEKAPEHLTEGLGLTDVVVVPHWQNEKYGHTMRHDVFTNLKSSGYKTACVTDDQALIIDGDIQKIIP